MKVYLVCGVSGSGKSWVCEQFTDFVKYVPYDQHGFILPTLDVELHDRPVLISTTINRFRKNGVEVVPIFIKETFEVIKGRIIFRGGSVSNNLHKRWIKVNAMAEKYAAFIGTSSEVLEFLRQEFNGEALKPCIYKAEFANGKVYVGQAMSFNKRITHHRWRVNSDTPESKNLFYNAWRKHGEPTFSVIEFVSKEALGDRERWWINHHKANVVEHGYNLTKGGEGSLGRKLSDETKAKISKANTGKLGPTFSEEVIRKLKVCARRRKLTENSIARIRASKLGKPLSKEQKLKIGVAGSKPIERSDGKLYLNMVEAAKDVNSHPNCVMRVLSGKFKQHKGFSFTYITSSEKIDKIKEDRLNSK
jgi:group I intron endonuclease